MHPIFVILCGFCLAFPIDFVTAQQQDKYLAAAIEAERWIDRASIEAATGQTWFMVPDSMQFQDQRSVNLYSGSSGIVLFYLELYNASGNPDYLEKAVGGADYLLATLADTVPGMWNVGLYTGLAGVCFTLEKVFEISGENRFLEGARSGMSLLMQAGTGADGILNWGGMTDIIYGAAGIGLYLLETTTLPNHLELAKKVGHGLISDGIGTPEGMYWLMAPGNERHMPNFSHGTAGVCYFLLRLYEETGDKDYLTASMKGIEYLHSITDTSGLVFHHEPGGRELFYLGWCHGIAGTGLLFHKLYGLTGQQRWLDWLKRANQWVMDCGIPGQQTPGFWNNHGICCGSAGLATYYLYLSEILEEDIYRKFANMMIDDVLEAAVRSESGFKWVQAEHRVRPDWKMAQTGRMQGAAGIGWALLQFYYNSNNLMPAIRLPDSPF